MGVRALEIQDTSRQFIMLDGSIDQSIYPTHVQGFSFGLWCSRHACGLLPRGPVIRVIQYVLLGAGVLLMLTWSRASHLVAFKRKLILTCQNRSANPTSEQ